MQIAKSGGDFDQEWHEVRIEAHALAEQLIVQLGKERQTPAQVIDGYVFAKQNLARAMQTLMCSLTSDEHRKIFNELHGQVAAEVRRQYQEIIPEKYLHVGYKSDVHIDLFSTLIRHLGKDVEADKLRLVTADSVHTERRVRELRELGFDISWRNVGRVSMYKLGSLDLDFRKFPELVGKKIKKDERLPRPKRKEYLALLGLKDG